MQLKSITAAAVAALLVAGPALAQTTATAGTELNVRAAPSPMGEITGVLAAGDQVTIDGCLENITWCKVSGAAEGWASGQYLTVEEGSEAVPLVNAAGEAEQITIITQSEAPEASGADAAAGAAALGTVGALTAYALGGPIGAIAASAAAGAVAGDVANDLTEPNYQYIVDNPVDTIYLDGEVVVGAAVPAEVTSYEIPDVTYRYLRVNNQPVIIDPETNAIVAVLR